MREENRKKLGGKKLAIMIVSLALVIFTVVGAVAIHPYITRFLKHNKL